MDHVFVYVCHQSTQTTIVKYKKSRGNECPWISQAAANKTAAIHFIIKNKDLQKKAEEDAAVLAEYKEADDGEDKAEIEEDKADVEESKEEIEYAWGKMVHNPESEGSRVE